MKPNRSNPLFSRFFRGNTLASAVVIALAGFSILPSAHAANSTLYWDGATTGGTGDGASAGGASNWNTTSTNWDAGAVARVAWINANNDYAVFGGTAGTVTLASAITANTLTFTTTGYTLAGTSALTFPANGSTITTSGLASGSTTTISAPIAGTITGGLTIASNGDMSASGGGNGGKGVIFSGTNTFTGNIKVTSGLFTPGTADANLGNSANTITLDGGGLLADASKTISRAISITTNNGVARSWGSQTLTLSGVLSGAGTLTKTDGGTLAITNTANTRTGVTALGAGTISIATGNGLGTGALNITGTAGGTFTVANNNATTVANAISLPAPSTAQTYYIVKNTASATTGTELNLTGTITGGNANTTLLLNSNTAGDGTTSYRLSGANTFTGTVNLNRGRVVVTSASSLGASTNSLILNSNNSALGNLEFAGSFTLANPVTMSFANTISTGTNNVIMTGVLGGTAGVTKAGSGTLTLAANNTLTGATTVSAGTLKLDYTTNNGSKLADAAALTLSGGTLDLAGSNATPHLEIVGSTAVTANSSLTRSGATANQISLGAISSTGGILDIAANSIATTSNSLANGLLPAYITVAGAPATTNGSNEIIAATSLVDVNRLGGQISSAAASNVRIIEAGTGVDVSMAASGTTDIATLTNSGTVAPSVVNIGSGNILRLAATGTISAGTNGLTIASGTLTAGGADDTSGLIDFFNSSTAPSTISSAIADNGSGTVTLNKGGSGTLVLSGTNTYTGTTTVNSGTLALAGGNAILDSGFVTLNNSAALRLDNNETIGGLTGAVSTTVNLQSNTLTLDDPASDTYTGNISGTGGALVKSGTGTVTLAGTNSYTGGTTVTDGTLQANSTAALTGTVAVGASGTLALNSAGSTFANTLTGSGTVTLALGATTTTTTLSGNLSGFTGTLSTSAGGKLNLSATGANQLPAAATIKINTGGTLYQSSAATSLASAILLYGGSTGEAIGQVRLEGGATLSGAVTLFGNTTVGNNTAGNVGIISGNIGESGGSYGITKVAAGTITLAGTNTYTGPTTLSAGVLNITGNTGSSALSMAASTTLKGEGSTASLTTSGASNLVINPSTQPLAFTTGALSLGGVMTVSFEGGSPTTGSFRVMNYTGTDPSTANFALANAANYRNPQFTASVGEVNLSLGNTSLTWTSTGGSNWDVNTTSNWNNSTPAASKFFFGDAVTFSDANISANQTVNMAVDVQPSSITFDNTTYSYALAATTGKIIGTTGITKNGTNTVTLGGANGQNYSGPIAVNAGTLKMGNRDAFGTSSGITIASGATVDINGQTPGSVSTGGYTYTIAGTGVGGTGAIINTGASTASNAGIKNLILSADATIGGTARYDLGYANTAGFGTITGNGKTLTKVGTAGLGFRGDASGTPISFVVNEGYIWAEDTDLAFGGAGGSVTVNSGAKVGTYNLRTIATPITLNAGGAIYNEGGNTGTWTGLITLGGNASIITSSPLINISGQVVGSSTLTVSGTGTGLLSGSNTLFTGKVIVDTDILRISQDTALGAVPSSLVADAITLTNGGRIQTGNATAGLDLTINPNRGITLGTGGGGFQSWTGFTTTYNGPITGSGILIKSDGGTANLGGTNTNTGGIRIDSGKLILAGTNNLGTTNSINVNSGSSTLEVTSTGNVTTGAVLMGAAAGGVLVVDGTLSATSFNNNWRAGNGTTTGVTINGTMTVSGNYQYSINATTALNGTGSLSVGSFTMTNATTNVLFGANGLTFNNAGTFLMNSTNTFTQSAGTVNNTSAVADDIRIGSGGTGTYNLNGGTYNAVNTPTTIAYGNTGVFNIAAGTTANVNGFKFGRATTTNAGTLAIAGGTVNIGAGGISDGSSAANAITVTLGATTIGAWADWTGTPTMALTNGATTTFNTLDSVDSTTARNITLTSPLTGGTGALTKSGAGTLSLAGANTFTGATTIDGGKLHVGTSLASTSVTVNSGGNIQAGTVSTSGTSTLPALTMSGGGITARAAYSGGDKLVVSGTDAFVVNSPVTVNVIPSADLVAGDRIPIIDYTGTLGGTSGFAGLTAAAPNPHYSVSLAAGSSANSGEDDSMVVLVMGTADSLTWAGNLSGTWNEGAAGTSNWKLTSDNSSSKFYNLDVVAFDDVGVINNPVVTLSGTISPVSVDVRNETGTYTFQGAPISGAATLTKYGTGALTLAAANTYTGLTKLEFGTLNIQHAQALGTGVLTITGGTIDNTTAGALTLATGNTKNLNGSFTFTGTQDLNLGTGAVTLSSSPAITVAAKTLTVDSVVSGTGFTKAGAGTMVLNGANNYVGATSVNGGTLEVKANSGAKTYSVAVGATLKLGYSTGNSDYGYGVTVNGSGAADASGLYIEGGDSLVLTNTLTLSTAPSTVRAYGTGTGTLRGWDVNYTHLTVNSAASGSVIDTAVTLNGSGYGYRMNVASGASNATGDLIVNGPMPGGAVTGFANFRKEGAGSVLINSAATYAAGMDIRNGSVILGGNDRLPVGTYVTIGNGADSGKLVLNGYSQTLTSVTAAGTGTKSVVGGSATSSTLTVNNAAAVTYSGTIGGSGTNEDNIALIKTGAETLTLSGANTYSGNTTVNAGTLDLSSTGALRFVLGNAGVTNSVGGTATASFNGTFNIDTTAVTASSGTWNLVTVANKSYGTTFTISGGFADPEDDGIWTKSDVGGKTWTYSESAGTLTLLTLGYDAWATQITNAADRDRTDDPDSDGFTNLQEFLFGTDPTASNGALVTMNTSGGNLVLSWLQRETNAGYILKESTVLTTGSWSTSALVPALDGSQTGVPTDYDRWTVTIPYDAPRKFFRIEGTEN